MKYTTLLHLLLMFGFSNAQDTIQKYDRLGIRFGGQQTYLTDVQFSPLIYRANEVAAGLFYDSRNNKSNWNAEFSFATGQLYPPTYKDRQLYNTTEDIYGVTSTDSFLVKGNTLSAVLQIGYSYEVVLKTKWELEGGVAIYEQLMYPSSFVNIGIMNAASLVATARFRYFQSNNHEWTVGLFFPVAGLNTRFPYNGTVSQPEMKLLAAFFDATKFTTLNHYQQINLRLGYRHQLSEKWGIRAEYEFLWLNDNHPLSLKQYSNHLTAALDYSF
jgi:hypothetical protein